MKLLSLQPLARLRYLNAARRGGTEVCHLEFLLARVDALPPELDALVAAADLQGVVPDPETSEAQLLGVAVVRTLEALADSGDIPALDRAAALLAGDLYSVPSANRRGGFGDVSPVWAAFARAFRWVAGVAGNHDDVRRVSKRPGTHCLDCSTEVLDGLRVGGVGLIAGAPEKPGRRPEGDQLAAIELVLAERPDLVLLHEGPDLGADRNGSVSVSELLAAAPPPLTVCGHVHWPDALHAGPPQVLNVCERVVVMVRQA